MAPKFLFVYTLLTFLFYFHGIIPSTSMEIVVINDVAKTPAGIKFEKELGTNFTKQLLIKATNFIWSNDVFQQNSPSERKNIDVLEVRLKNFKGFWAQTGEKHIHISDAFIQDTKSEEMKSTFTLLMYHETTHILQWNGKGACPGSLTEGIASYTELKSKLFKPEVYVKPGEGNKWDQGSEETARFLEYCDGLVPGFVAKLNKKMRTTYNVAFFKELTGKPVEQLWKEYKAKYGKKV